ncbi:MAG: hypothetical protein AAGB11_12210 [Pseudomonadota bacterium]
MNVLKIKESDRILSFTFDDLVNFHGTRSICGLTVGYKVLERAFGALGADVTPLARPDISVSTAFPGPGARDAFECVTRAVSRERYNIVKDVRPSENVAEAAFGAYWFRVTYGFYSIDLGVKPDVIRPDFLALRRKEKAGEVEEAELAVFRDLQWELSDRIREQPAEAVVNLL